MPSAFYVMRVSSGRAPGSALESASTFLASLSRKLSGESSALANKNTARKERLVHDTNSISVHKYSPSARALYYNI